jgi:hypothetical protein
VLFLLCSRRYTAHALHGDPAGRDRVRFLHPTWTAFYLHPWHGAGHQGRSQFDSFLPRGQLFNNFSFNFILIFCPDPLQIMMDPDPDPGGPKTSVPEFIHPVFAKTIPKRWFSMTESEGFGLVFWVYKFGHRIRILNTAYERVHLIYLFSCTCSFSSYLTIKL